MAVPGRPTPQPGSVERPRYRDPSPEQMRRPGVNPWLGAHRELGRPIIPADEAWTLRDRWHEELGRQAPLHVEIGSGNGFFLRDLALEHPDWNILGIEIRYKRVGMCAKKLVAAGVENARILRYHAAFLDDLFEDATLDGLYVNHPDPWPKERHEKNRLISRWFLEDVVRLLRPGGSLRLKSDHRPNVDRLLELLDHGPEGEPLPHLPLEVLGVTHDLAAEGAPWGHDIETNYQRKMGLRGIAIHAVEIRRTDAPWPA